jgi:hypothetical protein
MTKRPLPSFDFARAYAAQPVATPTFLAADYSDDKEPEEFDEAFPDRFGDWSDEDDTRDSGLWDTDIETLAAMAVARAAHASHAVGSTLASTLERWR